jgi:hypothetical protein
MKMIIVAGKTIQEVKDQLNIIEGLAEAGHQCGVGGKTLPEIQEGLRKVLGDVSIPLINPNLVEPEPWEDGEDCCCGGCCECGGCEEDYPQAIDNEVILRTIKRFL